MITHSTNCMAEWGRRAGETDQGSYRQAWHFTCDDDCVDPSGRNRIGQYVDHVVPIDSGPLTEAPPFAADTNHWSQWRPADHGPGDRESAGWYRDIPVVERVNAHDCADVFPTVHVKPGQCVTVSVPDGYRGILVTTDPIPEGPWAE